ncbi:MAG: cadherin-like beta sandwich domain-containing protein [Bacilli bacterium]
MKKILKLLTFIFSLFLFSSSVNAASATISVNTSASQIIVGNNVNVSVTISSSSALGSWEYNLNYDKNIFTLVSSDVELHYAGVVQNANTKSVTYRYTFKAKKSGSASFYIDASSVIGFDESVFSVTNGKRNVKVITYAEYQSSLSNNNNLKSLIVEGNELNPEFNKDVTEYTVSVNEDVTEIKVTAIAEDNKAKVNGDGTLSVSAGTNSFNIVVVAENGSEKTYKLNVEVIDKNPIDVTIDEKKYTVVKISSLLTKPNSYVEKSITINEMEIPAFYSEITDFTLVGLKDENGNISLFIYEDGSYLKYIELSFGQLTLYPLNMDEEIKGYKKNTISIGENTIECLQLDSSNRYRIIKAINVETNEKGLYLYDTKDNSAIKYDDSYIKELENKNNLLMYSTIAFALSTILALIIFISKNFKKHKKNKKTVLYNETKNNINDNNEIKEIKTENEYYNIENKPKKKKK